MTLLEKAVKNIGNYVISDDLFKGEITSTRLHYRKGVVTVRFEVTNGKGSKWYNSERLSGVVL